MGTHSKTFLTGKWMETWMCNLFREQKRERQKEARVDYKLLLVMHSRISLLRCSEKKNCKCSNSGHPQESEPMTRAEGGPSFLLRLLIWFFLLTPQLLVSLFFGIGIICMIIHSGTLSAWSLLKLLFGMCPSSLPFCASASSRFSWWSSLSSTPSWAFSAASVRSER